MNERLNSRRITDLRMKAIREPGGDLDILQQAGEIEAKIAAFEALVWFQHLQGQVNASDARGMRGECAGVTVLTWCCAGRCLIQLQAEGERITLITADDEAPWRRDTAHVAPGMGPMGWQSIDATFVGALTLLYKATRYGHEIRLAPDENVTIG